jgi:hypothetical protein
MLSLIINSYPVSKLNFGTVKHSGPEDPPSPSYGAAGPGFDFTPEGWCLSLDIRWNDGMVEKWNNGYEKWMMA